VQLGIMVARPKSRAILAGTGNQLA
jgi:hypothetical protein